MARKKVSIRYPKSWTVTPEYMHNGDVIYPGDAVRIKSTRGEFKFLKHVINNAIGREWIDVYGPTGYRSFDVKDLKGKVKPKRVKKNVGV